MLAIAAGVTAGADWGWVAGDDEDDVCVDAAAEEGWVGAVWGEDRDEPVPGAGDV